MTDGKRVSFALSRPAGKLQHHAILKNWSAEGPSSRLFDPPPIG
jgi:hypothetical protein